MSQPLPIVSDKTPFRSLLAIILNLVLGFVIVGPLIGFALAETIYDGNLREAINNSVGKTDLLYPFLVMAGTATFLGLILLPYIQLRAIEKKSLRPFFPTQPGTLLILVLVVILGFNFIVAISPLTEWNMNLKFPASFSGFEQWARGEEDRLAELTKVMTTFSSSGDLLLGIFVIALLPAIGEELVFRGLIQRELWRSSGKIHLAIWLTSFFFSAIHFQFFGFIPRLLLGALFGYLYYWSGNLLVPMVGHFINNSIGVIGLHFYRDGKFDINPEEAEAAPWPAVALCSMITVGLLFYIWKFYRDQRKLSPPREPEDLIVPLKT